MDIIFEITDKTGRKIRLTKKQWKQIIPQEKGNLVRYHSYQKDRKHPEKYLRIIVKYLNGDGFIVTAHFVRNLQ